MDEGLLKERRVSLGTKELHRGCYSLINIGDMVKIPNIENELEVKSVQRLEGGTSIYTLYHVEIIKDDSTGESRIRAIEGALSDIRRWHERSDSIFRGKILRKVYHFDGNTEAIELNYELEGYHTEMCTKSIEYKVGDVVSYLSSGLTAEIEKVSHAIDGSPYNGLVYDLDYASEIIDDEITKKSLEIAKQQRAKHEDWRERANRKWYQFWK